MTNKKRGLGRGLAALINDDIDLDMENETIKDIDVNLIFPNKYQPRQDFKDENIQELSNSIKINGLIQPIVIRKVGKKYEIIAGERRLRAAKMAGLKDIPSIIKDIDEERSAKFALIENIQREDLNIIEEAKAYKDLIEKYKLTQEQLASEMSKSRSYISNSIRILSLDKEILDFIIDGKLSQGHAKVILSLKDKKAQKEIAEEIINNRLSVRQTEELINKIENKLKDKNVNPKASPKQKPSNIIEVEENLMNSLGTKVNLRGGDKKGKIEIEYYSLDDLERIIEILTKWISFDIHFFNIKK